MARSPSVLAAPLKRGAIPERLEPMLAVLSALPAGASKYSFEWKWDGVRAMCYFRSKAAGNARFTLRSRNQIDITSRYPELHTLVAALRCRNAVLDGEIVAMDAHGRPSFRLLQRRMHVNDPSPSLQKAVPVVYVLFDILYRNGRSLIDRPLHERRAILETIVDDGPSWQVSSAHAGDAGAAMLETARQNGLEGVVAKRGDSPYEPGRRSGAWLKVKVIQRQEFVVGGWVPEVGGRGERIGSMLLGYYDAAGSLRYAGRVGTGLNDADHAMLLPLFRRKRRAKSAFVERVPTAHVNFLAPTTVVEVEFRRWPDNGLVQQGAFKGVRFDKDSRLVVKERIAGQESTR